MARLTIAFRSDITLIESSPGAILETPEGRITLHEPSDAVRSILRTLARGQDSEDTLRDRVRVADGAVGVVRLQLQLSQYARLGLLQYTLRIDGEDVVIVEQMAGTAGLIAAPGQSRAGVRYRLSRFAFCRRDGDRIVLESPRSVARIVAVGSHGMAAVSLLARPSTALQLSRECPALSEAAAEALLALLASLSLIGAVDERGAIADEAEPPLVGWEFHDLLFHERSRRGRHDHATGATYRFGDALAPLPAFKPAMSDSVITLERPDLDRLAREEASFVQIVEHRRSIRAYADQPITLRQVGEFLYRTARVRTATDVDPGQGRNHTVTRRPYPSGGALHELELYLVANRCEGLLAGLYHYDPRAHALERLSCTASRLATLLTDASHSARLPGSPQLLLVIASRFQRRSWKYEGIAYANTLKNVGALYQTMYLVATAMGLAPCALGMGDARLFAAAVGLDPDTETSVGEFLLGSVGAEPL